MGDLAHKAHRLASGRLRLFFGPKEFQIGLLIETWLCAVDSEYNRIQFPKLDFQVLFKIGIILITALIRFDE